MHRNNSESSDKPSRIKALIARLAGGSALIVAALILSPLTHDTSQPTAASPTTPAAAAAPPTPAPMVQQASMASIVEVVIGRNDTLDAVFRRLTLNLGDLATIRHLPGIRQSLDFLKPGDAIKVTHTAGDIQELTRKVSETQTLDIVRQDAGFEAKLINNPVETRVRTANATIDSSLFQAAEAANISDTVALKLANVFAWDIDFVLDIREGDRFTAVYEQIYQDGKYLRDGEVLAAEFVNNGKVYRAVRFVSDSGDAGYYTPNGLAMRKAFLRAPVEFHARQFGVQSASPASDLEHRSAATWAPTTRRRSALRCTPRATAA